MNAKDKRSSLSIQSINEEFFFNLNSRSSHLATPGVNVIKLFFVVTETAAKKLECFLILTSFFQANVVFENKAGAYPSGLTYIGPL
jgi:hypothetical protein